MPNPEIGEEEMLRIALVDKFGKKYINEIPVKVGNYYFYWDMFDNQGTGAIKGEKLESDKVTRKEDIVKQAEKVSELARVLKRYGIRQEDIRGLGWKGNNLLCCNLSHGIQKDANDHDKCFATTLMIFDGKGTTGDSKYHFELEGGDDFGISCLNDGMVKHVMDLGPEQEVESGFDPGEVLINSFWERLRKHRYDMRNEDLRLDWKNRIAKLVGEFDCGHNLNKYIFGVMESMGLVICRDVLEESVEVTKEIRQKVEDVRLATEDVVEYISRKEHFANDQKTWLDILAGEKKMKTWSEIETHIGDLEEIYLLPDDVIVLPAVYLMIQWIAQRGGMSTEMAGEDLKQYWKQVHVCDVTSLPDGESMVFVSGLSVRPGGGKILKWVDLPRIKLLRDKLRSRSGLNLKIMDLACGEIR